MKANDKVKVICAGLPKTGTKSMAAALKILGFSVYDFDEQWAYQKDEFIKAFSTKEMPNFNEMYANCDAITDVPACLFHKEIFQSFPDAKVVLTLRDNAEMWNKSILKTHEQFNASLGKTWSKLAVMFTPSGRKLAKLWTYVQQRLTLDISDSQKLQEFYADYNRDVERCIPSNQLLVMNIKDGWQPLCSFLGVEVPKDVPWPHENIAGSYVVKVIDRGLVGTMMFRELMVMGVLFVLVLAVVFAFFVSA